MSFLVKTSESLSLSLLSASLFSNQAIGRVIRHKNDFGAVLLLDERFARADRIKELPLWTHPFVRLFENFGEANRELSNFFKRDRPYAAAAAAPNVPCGGEVSSVNNLSSYLGSDASTTGSVTIHPRKRNNNKNSLSNNNIMSDSTAIPDVFQRAHEQQQLQQRLLLMSDSNISVQNDNNNNGILLPPPPPPPPSVASVKTSSRCIISETDVGVKRKRTDMSDVTSATSTLAVINEGPLSSASAVDTPLLILMGQVKQKTKGDLTTSFFNTFFLPPFSLKSICRILTRSLKRLWAYINKKLFFFVVLLAGK